MNKLVIAALAATMPLAPATASTCWNNAAAEAAQIRNFEVMLMVSALRCRTGENDFLPAYNRFVREKRAALLEVNEALRLHFIDAAGPVKALDAYDDYVISLSNSYGAGVSGLACRDLESLAMAATALPADRASLLKLTAAAGIAPRLNGARCDDVVRIAQAATAPASAEPAQNVALAAPATTTAIAPKAPTAKAGPAD
ncbi:hypothetical protein [Sphingobium lactosutens]|uniref:hypothetical protein n=1 Tax=Sphingobium lactosutens TaxID=522773 RepID=UPI0021178FEF|nr:hypothetical protein [Sphingobium lactosutens]